MDKCKLYWLIDQYIFGNISTNRFCNKYFDYFLRRVNFDALTEVEGQLFSDLFYITDRFSPYKDDHLQNPGELSTRNDVMTQVVHMKTLLQADWPFVYRDQSVILRLNVNGRYQCGDATDNQIGVLGLLFSSDIECNMHLFKSWLDRDDGQFLINNITRLERDGDFIIIRDMYPEAEERSQLEIDVEQFVWLLNDWYKRVYMQRPQEVSVCCKNGIFTLVLNASVQQ